jgi:hypothetical protein
MLTKIAITGTLLAALTSFKPAETAESVGWKTLRNCAAIAVSGPR